MHAVTRRDEVIPPYGSSPEKECPPRERPGEGTRPYGYIPESAINNPSLNVTVKPRIECAAERPPRISRVPEGQRGRPEGKVRGSRKRGYRKPGRKSGCPVPPFANPGCRPAATLPPPKAAKRPRPPRANLPTPWVRAHLASCVRLQERRNRFHLPDGKTFL